ncbi:MAG TPA: DUF6480 family protein [Mycobacteriales bacterium]|nr:DUF6480 family protein [Mycobacteriales bacterium]
MTNPDPDRTPGLDAAGGVAPGDTPPGEASTPGVAEDKRRLPNQGPTVGNRTPMVVTLIVVGVIVVLVLLMLIGMALSG